VLGRPGEVSLIALSARSWAEHAGCWRTEGHGPEVGAAVRWDVSPNLPTTASKNSRHWA
jgi:hypothetical protein